MSDAYMQYEVEEVGLVARWHGGAYIDLGYVDETGEFHAHDVINVWNYAKGESRIPFTLDALREQVDDALAEEEE